MVVRSQQSIQDDLGVAGHFGHKLLKAGGLGSGCRGRWHGDDNE